MSRIDLYGVRKGEEFRVDTVNELHVIASGEIGAADAVVEQHVATQDDPVLFAVKGDVAGRMTGYGQNGKGLISQVDDVALLEKAVGRLVLIVIEAVVRRINFCGPQHRLLRPRNEQMNLEGLSDEFISKHVINMAMGIEQKFYAELVCVDELPELQIFVLVRTARVNDHTLLRFIKQHIGVFLKGIEYEGLYLQHEKIFYQK